MYDYCTVNFDLCLNSAFNCALYHQFSVTDNGLYSKVEIPMNIDESNYTKFCETYKKMTPLQKQFFIEPSSYLHNNYIFCPGGNIDSFYFYQNTGTYSLYEELNPKDKLLILKWIFSVICASQILIEYDIKYIDVFSQTVFIDSKMEARFFYSNWVTMKYIGVLRDKDYYKIPRKGNSNEPSNDIEKDVVFSIGILLMTLLNRQQPSKYFQHVKHGEIRKVYEEEFLQDCVPQCELKSLIEKMVQIDPKDRPCLYDVIGFLLNPKNCLKDVNYSEFRRFVDEKFGTNKSIDICKLEKIICDSLSSIHCKNDVKTKQEPFTLKEIPNFIEIAKKTSSFGGVIEKNLDKMLDKMINMSNLDGELVEFYIKNKNNENKFSLMEEILVENYDYLK